MRKEKAVNYVLLPKVWTLRKQMRDSIAGLIDIRIEIELLFSMCASNQISCPRS